MIVGSTCRENDGEWKRERERSRNETSTVYIVTMVTKPYCCLD